MGIIRLLLALLLLTGTAFARDSSAWTRAVAGAEVDWRAGTITAEGGAAADMRMPGPNSARPGAERRARAAAAAKIAAALHELGADAAAEKGAIDHATVARIEYQSDGGVVLWLSVNFSDLTAAKPAPKSLHVATASFKLAPAIVAAGKSVHVASASYRPAAEAPSDAISAKRDDKGRFALPSASASLIDSFAGAAVVIYVDKPEP